MRRHDKAAPRTGAEENEAAIMPSFLACFCLSPEQVSNLLYVQHEYRQFYLEYASLLSEIGLLRKEVLLKLAVRSLYGCPCSVSPDPFLSCSRSCRHGCL